MTQFIANATFKRWFVRFSTEAEFNHKADNLYKGGNIVVSRLFNGKNPSQKYGVGAIVSYINSKGMAAGLNVVSVNPFGDWKFISLTTYQLGDDISMLEFQPGLYLTLKKGWYIRNHPRMIFDFASDYYEVPVGAGFGNIIDVSGTKVNLLVEPQYDFSNNRMMLYAGVKALF
ncbi:hypothetical protein [Carboxylicivirga sp. N1Y90]|uniref:hypothetical protein n=1 Tax=Carboxylicivirga fragile TaxID=3417571 RepID=UPI003D33D3D6|nr:hypothetical protein [Marinilabiliaceae bacterium N1Y90]